MSNVVFLCSNEQNLPNTEQYKVTLKLHIHFSYPYSEKLVNLLHKFEINDQKLKSDWYKDSWHIIWQITFALVFMRKKIIGLWCNK